MGIMRQNRNKETTLPLGKLPPQLLSNLIGRAPIEDPRVLVGPGIGIDCAVLDLGEILLVLKSDPITFASDEIGWYLVQVNANDLATTGAAPRWLMVTALLPEGSTTPELVDRIGESIFSACRQLGISMIGGHTEITSGLDRPILSGTLIGEVERDRLVTPMGAQPGDRLLLTKGVPVEATAILAREFSHRLDGLLTKEELEEAKGFLFNPGISVVKDARIAMETGAVHAMHDPTEGGLASALWEISEASKKSILFRPENVIVPPLSAKIMSVFDIAPHAAIASGALLCAVPESSAAAIVSALEEAGIPVSDIGEVEDGPVGVWVEKTGGRESLPRPDRDEIARIFEEA